MSNDVSKPSRTNGKVLTALQWCSLLLFRRALITETHIVLRQAEGWVYLAFASREFPPSEAEASQWAL